MPTITAASTSLPVRSSITSDMDPWRATIGRLRNLGKAPVVNVEQAPKINKTPTSRNNTERLRRPWNAAVDVLDRLSPCRVVIAWRDATAGCYGSQIWQASTAKTQDVCILTGREIESGDLVYRPRMSAAMMPNNADALILASALEQVLRCRKVDE